MPDDPTPPEILRVTVFTPDGETEREATLEDLMFLAPILAADWG